MSQVIEGQYKNTTLTDVKLASAFYPILVDLAKHKHVLTYEELVERAQHEYPNNKLVKNLIPLGVGRRLDVIRVFTKQRDLSDLAALIISKATGKPGPGYLGDYKAEQKKAYAYTWIDVSADFDGFVTKTEKALKPRKRINKKDATEMMSAYGLDPANNVPRSTSSLRDFIIELIMDGIEPKDAFDQAMVANDD